MGLIVTQKNRRDDPQRPRRPRRKVVKQCARPMERVIPKRDYGEAMQTLNDNQRCFVITYIDLGGKRGCATEAARIAGYGNSEAATRVAAYDLMHNKKILDAIREETENLFRAGAPRGVHVIYDMLESDETSQKVRADLAKYVTDKNAILPTITRHEHKVVHEVSTEELLKQIQDATRNLTPLERKLLNLEVVEGEYEEVGVESPAREDAVSTDVNTGGMFPSGNTEGQNVEEVQEGTAVPGGAPGAEDTPVHGHEGAGQCGGVPAQDQPGLSGQDDLQRDHAGPLDTEIGGRAGDAGQQEAGLRAVQPDEGGHDAEGYSGA